MVACVQDCREFPRATGSAPIAWGDAQRLVAARGLCAQVMSKEQRNCAADSICRQRLLFTTISAALDHACLIISDREFSWAVVVLNIVCTHAIRG